VFRARSELAAALVGAVVSVGRLVHAFGPWGDALRKQERAQYAHALEDRQTREQWSKRWPGEAPQCQPGWPGTAGNCNSMGFARARRRRPSGSSSANPFDLPSYLHPQNAVELEHLGLRVPWMYIRHEPLTHGLWTGEPRHFETMPKRSPRRRNSYCRVAVSLAPVQPRG